MLIVACKVAVKLNKLQQNRNTEIFIAAFYADLNELKKLVINKNDTQIKVEIPEGDYSLYWEKEYFEVNILDILNWAYFGFYEYVGIDNICHKNINAENIQILNDCINPSEYYNKVIECLEWICNKFSIQNYSLIDYSKFRTLRHFLLTDENWLDEDEFDEALKRGYKKVDLDLINEAEKGNGIYCYKLVQQGGNYKIDPIDLTDGSAIIEILGIDISFHTLKLISYLCNKSEFDKLNAYEMLASLYQVGVSNYILDIVTTGKNNKSEI